MPARVAHWYDVATAALDQRGQVGFPKFLPESNEIAFPVSELIAFADLTRTLGDGVRKRDV